MNAFALIPARGGSKGIPRKNLLPIGGKPLIAWTIEAARSCSYIERVVVSSEDEEILSVARAYGAEVIERPAELSTDTASVKSVLQHALVEYKKRYQILPEYVAFLQPTSPLRRGEHLTKAFEALVSDKEADAVMSAYEIDNSILKASILNTEGYLEYAAQRAFANMNRQMLPKLYMPNGAIYIMRAAPCIDNPRFDGEKTLPFVMSADESLDLDRAADIAKVEAALKNAQ